MQGNLVHLDSREQNQQRRSKLLKKPSKNKALTTSSQDTAIVTVHTKRLNRNVQSLLVIDKTQVLASSLRVNQWKKDGIQR